MPQGDKSTDTGKHKRQAGASDNANEQGGMARPGPQARAWATASKLHGEGEGKSLKMGTVQTGKLKAPEGGRKR